MRLLLLVPLLMLSACATILSGTKETVYLKTAEDMEKSIDVTVTSFNSTQHVTLPTQIVVQRDKNPIEIRVDTPCYTGHTIINPMMNNTTWWNIGLLVLWILPGVIGFAVDATNGAMNDYPNVVLVNVNHKTGCGN